MKCPVCRAHNDTGPDCRRCRADLALLWALEKQRADLVRQAQRHAYDGDWPTVLILATAAAALRRDDDVVRLQALSWLMQGNFARAWESARSLTNYDVSGQMH